MHTFFPPLRSSYLFPPPFVFTLLVCAHVTLCSFYVVYKTVKFGETPVTKTGRPELFLKSFLRDTVFTGCLKYTVHTTCIVCCCSYTFIKNEPSIITRMDYISQKYVHSKFINVFLLLIEMVFIIMLVFFLTVGSSVILYKSKICAWKKWEILCKMVARANKIVQILY